MNILLGLGFIFIGLFLFWANKKNLIKNETLSTLDNIASILAFLLGLFLFVWPYIFNNNESSFVQEKMAVENVIETEATSAVELNLSTLESIYAPDAIVINRRGTPNYKDDDTIYKGWDDIRLYHYIGFQSYYDPETMELVDLNVDLNGDKATATHKGVILNGEYREDISIYTLEKRNGNWVIVELEFGNE